MSEWIISVDLGGTNVRAARFDRGLNPRVREETLTLAHEGLEPTLGRIKRLIQAVYPTNGASVLGIGVSVPGPANPYTGVVVHGTNLGWENVPLSRILHEEFGVPIYLGNDANLAALAEVARGAAQGARHAIFITVSTGIGGGIIIDGRLLLGKDGLAAEVGHTIVIVGKRVSSLEKESAGPALARHAVERLQAGETSLIRDMVGGDLSQIKGSTVGKAAAQGDPLALDIAHHAGQILGLSITSLLHLFNPEIVVLGGSVTFGLGELLFKPMWDAIHKHALDVAYWENLKIVKAGLGENVSLIGAGALVVTRGGVEDVTAAISQLDAD